MRAAPAAAALVIGLSLVGCGSGGSTTAPVPSVVESRNAVPRIAPLRVSGGGSAQFLVKGGDNSIAEYGSEADADQLHRAATLVHRYFVALASEDWATACSSFSRREQANLRKLIASSPKLRGKDCSALVAQLIGKVSPAAAHEGTVVDAAALRIKGEQGFLIYHGAKRRPYFISLERDGANWAVAAVTPTSLP